MRWQTSKFTLLTTNNTGTVVAGHEEYYDALAKTVALVPWQPPHTRTADAFKTSQRIESSAHALHAHLGLRGGLLLLGHLFADPAVLV